jgi:DNA segregation ATPase FtsK/SpoIIIE-like protein
VGDGDQDDMYDNMTFTDHKKQLASCCCKRFSIGANKIAKIICF